MTVRQPKDTFGESYKASDFTFKDVKGANFTKIGRAALALGAKKVRITYHDTASNARTTTVLHTTNGMLHYKHNRPLNGLADLSLNEVYTIVFDLQPERSA